MRKFIVAAASAAGLLALSVAPAQAGVGGEQPPTGVVSATPATGTPHLDPNISSPLQWVRQIVQCGNTMYAVGTFGSIIKGSTTYSRNNIVSFSATSPFTVTSWAPDVVGTSSKDNGVINTIAFVNGNCADAYIGGHFTSINGTTVKNIAEIDTTTGNVVSAFGSNASGTVQTMQAVGNHLLVGGMFKGLNGDTTDPYMVSVSPTTGKSDNFLRLNISGNYSYAGSNPTRVYNQQLSHNGTLDLVEGDFTSVGGQQREQMFMLNVGGSTATVTGWTSPEFDGSSNAYPYQCVTIEPFYIQAAAWSPDDSTIYIATTGYHPNGYPVGATPRTGLCDAAAAFPSTQTSVTHKWVDYTGCDSLFSAAADTNAVYIGGHQRWFMNPDDCDAEGPAAYSAPGLAGLDPANGNLYVNSAGTAGYYSRSRGQGADDMLLTSAGLWVASDNQSQANMCGGKTPYSGICFLPYSG